MGEALVQVWEWRLRHRCEDRGPSTGVSGGGPGIDVGGGGSDTSVGMEALVQVWGGGSSTGVGVSHAQV